MNQKIMVVIIVAVIVIAGTGVVLLTINDENDSERTYLGGVAGCLQVYGNANNDYVIDSEDKELVQKLVSEETSDWKENYPFADANYDGILDSEDVDYIEELIGASATDKVTAHVVCYAVDRTDGYVEDILVPVTCGSFNLAITTVMAMRAVGIRDEICAISHTSTWADLEEPTMYDVYRDLTTDEYCIGIGTSKVDPTLAANFTKSDDPLTCYILSSGNAYDYYGVRDSMKELGISIIEIDDSAVNPLKYATGILLLGYLFGTDNNDYAEVSHNIADWLADFNGTMNSYMEELDSLSITKKTCVISTSSNYVSSLYSSYSKDTSYYGLTYGIDGSAGTSSSLLKYNPGNGDTWLNSYSIDIPIAISGQSTSDWRWYDADKDPSDAPAKIISAIKTFETMKNYDNALVITSNMPAPVRALFIMEYAYPELFEESVAYDVLEDYCHEFYGWSENCLDGVVLVYTAADLGLL